MSQFHGNTTIASVMTPDPISEDKLFKLWVTQVALYSYNNFNLILEKAEGLFYTTVETFDELIPYLQKYYKEGYLNTGGRNIDKYIQRVLKNYVVKEYPNRPAYLLYVCGKSKFERGENKIMGVPAEGLEVVKSKANELKGMPDIQAKVAKHNPILALGMMLESLVAERAKEEKEEGSKVLSEEEFDKKFPNTDIDFLLKGLKMPSANDLKTIVKNSRK